ncbi:MAG: PEP-CTERM sorting domain-containing protein [Candidatus Omnitrophica bacterium]|nr:PEP-CTERM sorting domain-containing protein [Candidatus Omnitrophota bacterium]
MKRFVFFCSALLMMVGIGIMGSVSEAQAVVLDLTTAASSGFVNGAFFLQTDLNRHATGTGIIDSFVRIQHNGTEEGYNTDGRPLPLWPDVNTSPVFTHSITLGSVPVVTINGVDYREFLLDINQTAPDAFLSLDELQIFIKNSGSITSNLASLGVPIYDLDAAGDSYVKLNYILNPGSGKGDMFAYIPESLFTTAADSDFVYLYSQLGTNFASNDGFEEWAICPQLGGCLHVIPEPSSFGLLGVGLLGLLKRKKKTLFKKEEIE